MSCNYGDFQCSASGRCIEASMRCDNRLDCDDGSDEAECDSEDIGDEESEDIPGDYRYQYNNI